MLLLGLAIKLFRLANWMAKYVEEQNDNNELTVICVDREHSNSGHGDRTIFDPGLHRLPVCACSDFFSQQWLDFSEEHPRYEGDHDVFNERFCGVPG